MKFLKILFVFLLLLFVDGGLRAQTVEKTNTFTTNFQVRCEGIIIDVLRGTVETHFLTHYKNGIVDWFKQDMESVNLVSTRSGEHFYMSYHQKQDGPGWLEPIVIVSIHYNCVGDMGSHYIIEEIIQSDFTNIKPPQQPVNTYLKLECKCL
jgi:hypothetical protein